jgi:hypothetical protein
MFRFPNLRISFFFCVEVFFLPSLSAMSTGVLRKGGRCGRLRIRVFHGRGIGRGDRNEKVPTKTSPNIFVDTILWFGFPTLTNAATWLPFVDITLHVGFPHRHHTAFRLSSSVTSPIGVYRLAAPSIAIYFLEKQPFVKSPVCR